MTITRRSARSSDCGLSESLRASRAPVRINSEFAFIKDRRRNRLSHDKANKLDVAIFHNLRLLTRMNKPNYVEPAVGWNCEDNHVGVIKYGVADYEPRKNSTPISAPKRPELLQPWPENEPLQLQLDDVDGQPLLATEKKMGRTGFFRVDPGWSG